MQTVGRSKNAYRQRRSTGEARIATGRGRCFPQRDSEFLKTSIIIQRDDRGHSIRVEAKSLLRGLRWHRQSMGRGRHAYGQEVLFAAVF